MSEIEIISRKEAKERGLTHYFTGKECKNGHVSVRYVLCKHCVECVKIQKNKFQDDNPDYYVNYRFENRDKAAETSLIWRTKNRDKHRIKSSIYGKENRENRRAYEDNWRKENPEKVKSKSANRRSRKRNAEGHHTFAEIADIYTSQNGLCVYCNADLNTGYHVDHIMPLALGGSNWPDNLQCLCPTCNVKKGAKHPDVFLKEVKNGTT
jgi:5-methylcytosine-specific restriction endonuclease McrA